jgi:ornithine cyclodeaminase
MKLRVLSATHIAGLVSMPEASEAKKAVFRELSKGHASAPPRGHVDIGDRAGKTLVMAAHVPGFGLASKIVSYFPNNHELGLPAIHGVVLVLDEHSGRPTALLDGTGLTAFRTGAGTAASIDVLARQGASRGALFGTGGQAAMQLLAMDAVRDFDFIRVFGRRAERTDQFVATLQPSTRARLERATDPAHAVRDADVVVAATSSSTPVFDGRDLTVGCHVAAIGGITFDMHEVDSTTLARARVFVDSLPGCLAESGELAAAFAEGGLTPDDVTELGAVIDDPTLGRRSDDELTFYKSVGHAVQDVAIARLVLDRAAALQLGEEIEL